MKRISILAIAATALLVSCDKDNNNTDTTPTPTPKTKTELLTAGKWQVTAATTTVTIMGQDTTEDEFQNMEACDKDDFTLFSTDGNVAFDEGATKCDSNANQVSTGQWAFLDNETKLILTQGSYSDTADVDELTDATLKVSFSYTDSLSSYKSVRTYGRIN